MITGFRLGPAGATGWSGVAPDLWCFGKVIGGGLPVGAFAGRRDLMAELAPGGPVYQAGTLSGNPLATAAGLAVLGQVGPADYEALAARAAALRQGPRGGGGVGRASPSRRRRSGRWSGCSWPPRRRARSCRRRTTRVPAPWRATGPTAGFFHAMLRRGVALAPGPYEVMFPGMAHDERVLSRVVEAAAEAAAEVAGGLG